MASPTVQVIVPDIGDFDEVEVIEVLVAKGDRVEVEDSLITLESDKATMEIPSPQAGVVAEIHVQLGALVSQGSLVLVLEVEADAASDSVPEPEAAPRESAVSTPPAETPPVRQPGEPPPSAPPVPLVREGGDVLPHASPLVRKMARELGVDLSQAAATGPAGRVLVEDVTEHVRQTLTSSRKSGGASGHGIPAVRKVNFARYGEIEEAPLSRIRQRAGHNLSASWLNVPHVTQHDEADITELEAYRKSKGAAAHAQGVRLSPLVFVMKAVVLALRRFPDFGASLAPDGKSIILKKSFHLGVAVDTENGLVVPVVRDVNQKRLVELARETSALAETARDGKLSPEQMSGACFTISSLGGLGGTAFTPIVNAPEVAVLGVSRTVVKPVWSNRLDVSTEGGGRFEPRLVLPLSLSYDHRVIDGAAAVRFTSYLRSTLENPGNLLL